MEGRQLLTTKDVAERWQVNTATIQRYAREGVLTPCTKIQKKTSMHLFTPEYIADLEGVELERFSPLERKKLEREIEYWKQKYLALNTILSNILAESSKVIAINMDMKGLEKR